MAFDSLDLGKLNRKVQIQQETSGVQDAFGQPLPSSWQTVRTCWADIDIQASQLVNETEAFISKVTHRITMRMCKSLVITPNMRVVYADPYAGVSHIYEIEAVLNPRQQNFVLVLLCYELNEGE
jgi:SPP1 family predicted phage head-tail adaptor